MMAACFELSNYVTAKELDQQKFEQILPKEFL